MENKIKEMAKLIPAEVRAEFVAKLQKCANAEAVKALVKEYNLPITDEMIEQVMALINTNQVLSNDDLAAIAGGTAIQTLAGCGIYYDEKCLER